MNNEEIVKEYIEMTRNSWTYQRLTMEEKSRLIDLFYHVSVLDSLKYTREHKWKILHDVYFAFLIGLDYKPIGWREDKEEK